MDPVTILTGLWGTLTVIKEVYETIQWMQRVYESVKSSDKTLRLLALEAHIYGDSIKTIGAWLKENAQATDLKQQMRTTNHAIILVKSSMSSLRKDLRKVADDGQIPSAKHFKQFITGAKHQWFQQTMSIHLNELRAHGSTLQLALQVIQLTRDQHPVELKEAAPQRQKLDEKTRKLEKRLLLRHFIGKACEMKRKELEQSPSVNADAAAPPPPRQSFYDVVRQAQALAQAQVHQQSNSEMAPAIAEVGTDLIDFSGDAEEAPCATSREAGARQVPAVKNRYEEDLLDLYTEVPLKQPEVALNELDGSQKFEIMNNEISHQKIETQTSNSAHLEASFASHTLSDQVAVQELATEPSTLAKHGVQHEVSSLLDDLSGQHLVAELSEQVEPETSSVSQGSNSVNVISNTAIAANPIPILLNPIARDQGPVEEYSPTSTAAPSIFSHSSTLTGSTSSTMSGITEEDIQSRKDNATNPPGRSSYVSSHSASSVRRKAVGLPKTSWPKPPASKQFSPTISTSLVSTPAIEENPEFTSAGYFEEKLADEVVAASLSPDTNNEPQDTEPQIPSTLTSISDIDKPDAHGMPWIVQAAHDGDETLIRKLLASDADVKAANTITGRHALSEASMHGHEKCVDILIQEGCPIDLVDGKGYTALHHACQTGHIGVAKRLIAGKAFIDALGPHGQTALHLATRAPHQNIVMLLLQHHTNANARDESFQTPLHISARQGNVAMCSYLLDQGAQLDSREANSKTALQVACESGHHRVVEAVLNHADLLPTHMTFQTAFLSAVECGHVRIAEAFFSRGLNLTDHLKKDAYKPPTLSAKHGNLAMLDLLIREDCDIKAKDDKEWNALHFASYHGHWQLIDRLIAKEVPLRAVTNKKDTPLLLAVKRGHFAVAEILLRSMQGGNIVGMEGAYAQQAIHHACRLGSFDILNLLLNNGAKTSVEDSFGWHPLHIATAYGHSLLVNRLLENGANIEEKLGSSSVKRDQTHKVVEDGCWAEARWPYSGSRPLHLACEFGQYQIACTLMSRGAKIEAVCSEGWRPLHHAAFDGSCDLVNILLEGGAYPHAQTAEGKTPVDLQFRTSGAGISNFDKEAIRASLTAAMAQTSKQKTSYKVALKKARTVEEKNNLIRAAIFSMNMVSKPSTPHVQRTISGPPSSQAAHSPAMSNTVSPPTPSYPFPPLSYRHTSSSVPLSSGHSEATDTLATREAPIIAPFSSNNTQASTTESISNANELAVIVHAPEQTQTFIAEKPSASLDSALATNEPPTVDKPLPLNKFLTTSSSGSSSKINAIAAATAQQSRFTYKRASSFGLSIAKQSVGISRQSLNRAKTFGIPGMPKKDDAGGASSSSSKKSGKSGISKGEKSLPDVDEGEKDAELDEDDPRSFDGGNRKDVGENGGEHNGIDNDDDNIDDGLDASGKDSDAVSVAFTMGGFGPGDDCSPPLR